MLRISQCYRGRPSTPPDAMPIKSGPHLLRDKRDIEPAAPPPSGFFMAIETTRLGNRALESHARIHSIFPDVVTAWRL